MWGTCTWNCINMTKDSGRWCIIIFYLTLLYWRDVRIHPSLIGKNLTFMEVEMTNSICVVYLDRFVFLRFCAYMKSWVISKLISNGGIRIAEKTERSQFLAYFSFTPRNSSRHQAALNFQPSGGRRIEGTGSVRGWSDIKVS